MNMMVKHCVASAQCLVYVECILPDSILKDLRHLTNKRDMELNPYLYKETSSNIQFNSFHIITQLITTFFLQVISLLRVPVHMENHSHMVSIFKKFCCPVQIHLF
jgi:hypothetical protein